MSKQTLREQCCPACGFSFLPKRADQEACSVRCRNTLTARRSAALRGDTLRGRTSTGSGRYPKMLGRPAHRAAAEAAIGRPLTSREIAHHMNGDKSDFRRTNIIVISSQSAHARITRAGLAKKRPPRRTSP